MRQHCRRRETNRIPKRTAAAARVSGNHAHRNKKAHRRSATFCNARSACAYRVRRRHLCFVVVPKITDTVNPTQEIYSGEEVTTVIRRRQRVNYREYL